MRIISKGYLTVIQSCLSPVLIDSASRKLLAVWLTAVLCIDWLTGLAAADRLILWEDVGVSGEDSM